MTELDALRDKVCELEAALAECRARQTKDEELWKRLAISPGQAFRHEEAVKDDAHGGKDA